VTRGAIISRKRARELDYSSTDPATLPTLRTWYVVTNLPAPGSSQAAQSPLPAADAAEIVRLSGVRTWMEKDQPYYAPTKERCHVA
jgi:hypothetical protein